MSDNTEPFCKEMEAHKVTPLAITAFRLHVKQGRIPSYKFGRNRWFRKSEVIAAIEKCRVATTAEVVA
jgi:myosin heavy subunit